MSGAPDTCGITVVRARGRRLAKLIRRDGAAEGYDAAKTVDLHPRRVAGLVGLHALLEALADRPDCCAVRGEPADPARVLGVRRLSRDDARTGDAATLREMPRRWVALDLDDLPLPAATDPRDLAACRAAVAPLLPAAFGAAACLVQATARHAIRPGARLRLWFWLSRPVGGTELRLWLRGAPVDASIFRCAQPIYTARPLFEAGAAADPLPRRLAMLPGTAAVEAPDAAAPAPPRRVAAAVPLPTPARGDRYAMAALARAGAAIRRGEGGRHPLAVKEAMGLARLVRAGLVTRGEVERVIASALDVPGRGTVPEEEAAGVVAWALAHAAEGTPPEGAGR